MAATFRPTSLSLSAQSLCKRILRIVCKSGGVGLVLLASGELLWTDHPQASATLLNPPSRPLRSNHVARGPEPEGVNPNARRLEAASIRANSTGCGAAS